MEFFLDIHPPTVTAQEHKVRVVRGKPMGCTSFEKVCGLSATRCAFRLGALPAILRRSSGQSGGARFIRGSSFPFSFRAFRSAPGGKVRSLGAPREPSRAGGLGRGRRGGRSRWRRKNREPVAVVGRGRRGAAGVSGRRAFPPPATPVSLWSGKKASHKTANKKRLSVAQTSPFRKNWLFRAL